VIAAGSRKNASAALRNWTRHAGRRCVFVAVLIDFLCVLSFLSARLAANTPLGMSFFFQQHAKHPYCLTERMLGDWKAEELSEGIDASRAATRTHHPILPRDAVYVDGTGIQQLSEAFAIHVPWCGNTPSPCLSLTTCS